MRRLLTANNLLWLGLLLWALGNLLIVINADPTLFGYTLFRYTTAAGSVCLIAGCVLKIAGSLRRSMGR